MSVSYTCPNPECGVTLKTPNRVQTGKSVKCPKCGRMFVPEPEEKEAGPGTLKVADEPKKPDPSPAGRMVDDDDEDAESIKKGYGVIAETEEEKEKADKNKPKFTEVQDKFKKSARGPAMSLLVMPSSLLTFSGLITCVIGLVTFVIGMWPLVFNDAPPGEEEVEEAVVYMMLGVVAFFWGAMVCFGASQMQELASYPWAMVGAVMGLAPLLVGIFAIVMLQNPKVKAGFEEGDLIEEEEEDEEDDEDDDDDEGGRSKKGSTGKKLARKGGRGDDDEDEEDEE
jgi:cadmium resistance protein CadD (predicted permease)